MTVHTEALELSDTPKSCFEARQNQENKVTLLLRGWGLGRMEESPGRSHLKSKLILLGSLTARPGCA